jgi:aminopeptidase N
VKHPDEINEIFDRISYAKGASIIRMMNHYLTEKSFRGGLSNYLTEFAFKAAEQDDLWHYLTQKAHLDGTLPSDLTVKTIMDTWTLQMGFPVVNVTRDYDSNEATLIQKRFLISSPLESDTHDYKWWIPITFTKPGGDFNNTYSKVWMKDSERVKVINGLPNKNEAAIFNVHQTGYYRVNYDEENWKLIIKQLNEDHTKIHVINRAQIIDDALNLARAGHLKYELALGVTSYLNSETEYIPWAAALTALRHLEEMLKRTAAYGNFKVYMRSLIDPLIWIFS